MVMRQSDRRRIATTLALTFMTVVTGIVLLPLFIVLSTSLKTTGEIQGAFRLLPDRPMFNNYVRAFDVGGWATAFFNTSYIVLISTAICLFLSSLSAFALARMQFRGMNLIFMLFMVGLMVPAQTTIIPQFILFKNVPLCGGNNLFGLGGSGLLNTHWPLLISYCTSTFGVFLCRQYFLSIPSSLDEAAKIDGCKPFGIYRRIYLPLSVPVLITVLIMRVKYVWNDFFFPLIMVNDTKLFTVQMNLTKYKGQFNIEWNTMLAGMIISILPMIFLFVFCQRYFIEGIATSGMKG